MTQTIPSSCLRRDGLLSVLRFVLLQGLLGTWGISLSFALYINGNNYNIGPNINLSFAYLYNANLNNVNLSYANLSSANLSYASLSSANLSYANLSSANLTSANLPYANLSGTDLSGANLLYVYSVGIIGSPASLPSGWSLINGYLIGPNANLTYADLSGANLSGANLSGVDLSRASLSGVSSGGIIGSPSTLPASWSIINGYLIGPNANLGNADLSAANLSGATLSGVSSGGIIGTPSSLPNGWSLIKGYLMGSNAILSNADLSGANLSGVDLSSANLSGVSSGGITGTPFSLPNGWRLIKGYLIGPNSNLSKADLSNADLSNVNLNNANLSDVILTGVSSGNIYGTPKSLPIGWSLINGYLIGPGANLSGAKLNGAYLSGISSGAIIGTPSSLPIGWTLINGYLIGPNANLSNADLSNFNLSGANLSNANLLGVSSGGITGTPASLPTGWSLINGYLIGPGANLSNANLSHTYLTGVTTGRIKGTPASLPTGWSLISGYLIGPGANLTGVDLSGVDLSSANLYGVKSGKITGSPSSLPSEWSFISGYLIGPGANLSGFDLSGYDLSNANLQGVSSGGITGSPSSLPQGWSVVNGYLIGPGANLASANLSNANLSNADLSGANLSHANMSGANLSSANLSQSELSYANLFNANFSRANLVGVSSEAIVGTPSKLPFGWSLINGTLMGPGANLSHLDFSNLNLSSLFLEQTDLTDTVYTTNTVWPAGFDFLHKGALGPGVNFLGEDLSSNDLSGIDFTSASFTNCNLTGCNFAGSILFGANFAGANLSGANFRNSLISSGTIFPKGFNPVSSAAIVMSAAPSSQKITFPALPPMTYGNKQVPLKASSSSKLPVSYVIENPNILSLDGKNLKILGAGTTSVTAIQTGTSKFCWAPPVAQSVVIKKASQKIVFKAETNLWIGIGALNLTAYSSSGLPVTLSSSNRAIASVLGSTLTLNGTGTTTLTASQAGDDNYSAASSVIIRIVVSKAPPKSPFPKGAQTITFPKITSYTNTDNPYILEASSSSGLPIIYTSSNTNLATIIGSKIEIGGADWTTITNSDNSVSVYYIGTTTITASQPGNSYYKAAHPVSQVLSINLLIGTFGQNQ